MSTEHMIVPVTPKLAGELTGASAVIRRLKDESTRVSDQDYFVPAVDQLEALTVAVLSATSSTPMTAKAVPSARFALSSGGYLNRHVTSCVTYLRDEVSVLLMSGGFEKYSKVLTVTALEYLQKLDGLLRAAIIAEAESDLSRLADAGVNQLLEAAAALAKAAAGHGRITTDATGGDA